VGAVTLSSCGRDRTGGPAGDPATIVARAPAASLAADEVRLVAQARDAVLDATVRLRLGTGVGTLQVPTSAGREELRLDYSFGYSDAGPVASSKRDAPPELVGPGAQPGNPLVALDLLRGATQIRTIGGEGIRGASTLHYSLVVSPERAVLATPSEHQAFLRSGLERSHAVAIPADVWIDSQFRVRRLQLGNDLGARTTTTDARGIPFVTTLDLFDYSSA
jgi:hypothetical protein